MHPGHKSKGNRLRHQRQRHCQPAKNFSFKARGRYVLTAQIGTEGFILRSG